MRRHRGCLPFGRKRARVTALSSGRPTYQMTKLSSCPGKDGQAPGRLVVFDAPCALCRTPWFAVVACADEFAKLADTVINALRSEAPPPSHRYIRRPGRGIPGGIN